MNRKRYSMIGLAVGLLLGMQIVSAQAQEPAQDGRYLIGGGVPGSVPYNIGVGLSSLAQIVLLPEENLSLLPTATEGYDDSVRQIIDGQSQFAIVDSVAAHQAFAEAGDRLTGVATLWHEVDHFIIANEYIQSGTISDLAILRSENLVTDLGNADAARDLLTRFGVRIDSRAGTAATDWETRRDEFASGAVAGMAITGPVPSPVVQDMLTVLEGRAQLLEFSHWQMAQVGGGWHVHSLTAGDYPELTTQVDTVARTMMLVAHRDVPDEAVYQIVEMMFDNLPYLTNLDEAAAQISLNHAVTEINLPLHAGAARYYQEKGVLVDGDPVTAQLDAAIDHAAHEGMDHSVLAGHGQANGIHPPEHVHDEAMLSRARAEVHDGDVVLKIGRPKVLSHPATEIFSIYFGLGKVEPAEEDAAKIREISGKIMAAYETYGREPEVYVEGHTDRMGSWETNYQIAHLRARSVRDLLAAEGVPESWLHLSDYSEEGLAVPTADEVPEERNRRVEITLIPQE